MTEKHKTTLAFCALGLGAVMLGLGVWRGEAAVVLQKAVLICMECIGLG